MKQVLLDDTFKFGSYLVPLQHYQSNGEEVKLPVDVEIFPYLLEEVHLLSPHLHHTRTLLFMYIEELIQRFPVLEPNLHPDIASILKSLLIGMDYLMSDSFMYAPFRDEHRKHVRSMLDECFEKDKMHSFSGDNRLRLTKSNLFLRDDNLFALDPREERTRIYMAVLFQKKESPMDAFHQVAHLIHYMQIKPSFSCVSYEDHLAGKTDDDLHIDHIFFLNMIQRTLMWFLNSYSWRTNEIHHFDVVDICSKLGIR